MKYRGMTLLEVVLALALAAALMVTLLQVTMAMRKSAATVQEIDKGSEAADALVDLIGRDLIHARRVESHKRIWRIAGHFGIDREDNETVHRPVQATYVLVPDPDVPGSHTLVREQIQYQATGEHASGVEVLSWGLKDMTLILGGGAEPDDEGWMRWADPLPPRATVTLNWVDGRSVRESVVLE